VGEAFGSFGGGKKAAKELGNPLEGKPKTNGNMARQTGRVQERTGLGVRETKKANQIKRDEEEADL